MKLKVLLAPVLIVLIVVMAIWYVYPAFQDLMSKKESLNSEQNKLSDIQEKNNTAAALLQTLNGETDRRNTLTSYIPEQRKEEEMISALNALSGAEGLSVYKIAVLDTAVATAPNAAGADNAAGTAPAKPMVNNFIINLGVAGNYGKIKDLLIKIASLPRFNSIATLKITKVLDPTGADNSGSDNLQADISLNFNYMSKGDAVVNFDNAIFSSGKFDLAVVDDIKSKMSTVVNGLTVDAHGVPNPFVK